jgi:hypothetical protein
MFLLNTAIELSVLLLLAIELSVLLLLAIELSVLLRYTDSDYVFGIFKLFLRNICVTNDHGYVPFVVITISPFPHS